MWMIKVILLPHIHNITLHIDENAVYSGYHPDIPEAMMKMMCGNAQERNMNGQKRSTEVQVNMKSRNVQEKNINVQGRSVDVH